MAGSSMTAGRIYDLVKIYELVKNIGCTPEMDGYARRRLGIFNIINLMGFATGIFIPVTATFGDGYVPGLAWGVAFAPSIISAVVLLCNYYHQHEFAMFWYFITYPVITAMVYAGSIDVGIELLFILYGVLAVFFLQDMKYIVLTITFTVICYILTFVMKKEYQYVLSDINFIYYFLNQFFSLAFIFIGLFLIKKENTDYQKEMLYANWELKNTNEEIRQQKQELAELNSIKNRLFSVVSHDLKTPIYSLRNLFKGMHENNVPAKELKLYVPEILNDLNYTTGLMENLLLWAKSQMQGSRISPELINVGELIDEVKHLLRLQAENKKIYVDTKSDPPVYIYADKDMINLVLRNLLSNAIKFTPENGEVKIDTLVNGETVEVNVRDNGSGISRENMQKLFSNTYYTTKGTANESGTGLGLMLCKEFISKNGGDIRVQSEPGKGSVFSFTLPKA